MGTAMEAPNMIYFFAFSLYRRMATCAESRKVKSYLCVYGRSFKTDRLARQMPISPHISWQTELSQSAQIHERVPCS